MRSYANQTRPGSWSARQQAWSGEDGLGLLLLAVTLGVIVGVAADFPLVGLAGAGVVAFIVSLQAGVGLAQLAVVAFVGVTGLNLTDVLTDRYGLPSLVKPLMLTMLAMIAFEAVRLRRLPEGDAPGIGTVILFCAIAGISTIFAFRTEAAFEAFSDLIKNAAVAVVVGVLAASRLALRRTTAAFLAALGVLAAIAAYQALTGDYDSDFMGLGGADVLHIAGATDAYRLFGPFTDPNSFARILLLAIPIAIYELAHAPSHPGRVLAGLALSCVLTALIFTYSRGALIGLLVTFAAVAIRLRKRWRLLLGLVVFSALTIAAFAPETLWDRLGAAVGLVAGAGTNLRVGDESIGNRLDEMLIALRMFAENPIIGVGLGNYAELFQQYAIDATAIFRHEDRQAHSRFLEIAAEQGMIGLLAFAGLLWVSMRGLWAAAHNPALADADRDLAYAIGLAVASYLTASIFLHDDYPRYFWLFIGMAIAVPVALRSE